MKAWTAPEIPPRLPAVTAVPCSTASAWTRSRSLNSKGAALPAAGSIGPTIFDVPGGILVVGAVALPAATLEGYIQRDSPKPLGCGRPDRAGILAFPFRGETLAAGLYPVLRGQYTSGSKVYRAEPSLVLLPTSGDAATQWDYDVTVTPKYTVRSTDAPQTAASAAGS